MTSVYCIGELLIDFISTEHGKALQDVRTFEKKAGGAPANVAAAISSGAIKTHFLGQVGKDAFGKFLKGTLEEQNVDVTYLHEAGKTTLAFVSLDATGERSFEFFRGSDGEYEVQDEVLNQITKVDVIHFGSATGLLPGNLKKSYYQLLDCAVEKGCFISFDPNYRDLLIDDLEGFKEDCMHFMKHAHLIKLSEEEAMLLTDTDTVADALSILSKTTTAMITITQGAKGTLVVKAGKETIVPSIKIESVDTTGAGDCFIGTLLHQIAALEDPHHFLELSEFVHFIQYANVAGALTCTKYGAISALPTHAEITEKWSQHNDLG